MKNRSDEEELGFAEREREESSWSKPYSNGRMGLGPNVSTRFFLENTVSPQR